MSEQTLAISARQVVKCFGEVRAVDGIDLDIPVAQIYGFLGPNGSGKSTVIRVLLGLLRSTSGAITVLGHSVPEEAEQVRRQSGYMTQNFSLYRDLSVVENLDFVARVYGLSASDRRARINELVQTYRLEDFRDRRAGQTSGGQRQRLALAAAVLNRPRLLVLDEPTSAVDPQNRRDFWDQLFRLVEAGTTILVSTHYMDEAERCHQIAILKKGRIAALGNPSLMMDALKQQVFAVHSERLSEARRALGDQADVISVSQLGAQLRVLVEAGRPGMGQQLAGVLHQLDSQARIAQADPSLEDVFVDATRDVPA